MKSTCLALVWVAAAAASLARPALAQTAGAASNAPAKPTSLFPDKVVAKGKDVEVKESELDDEMMHLKNRAAANGQMLDPALTTRYKQRLLEDLIRIQLLRTRATEADKLAAKKTAAKRLVDARLDLGSDEALDRQIKAQGMTREVWMERSTDVALAENVLKRELNVNVSDADARKFYDDNPSKFELPEMVRASHILLMTLDPSTRSELSAEAKEAKRKQMEDILKRARAGEDFAKLAKDYSEDPGSKEKGGEYTFPRGQMVPEFEAAAFSLNTNQISDIVTTKYGYHIIKLSEKIPARKVEFDKVKDRVEESLAMQAIQKEFAAYYEKLKAGAGVVILDESLKPKETNATTAAQSPAGGSASGGK
jgi:peptidyl-prolyl cis-trans isomerase C